MHCLMRNRVPTERCLHLTVGGKHLVLYKIHGSAANSGWQDTVRLIQCYASCITVGIDEDPTEHRSMPVSTEL